MENAHVKTAEVKEVSHGEVKQEKMKDTGIKTLAVIGLAGILALVSFGVVKFAPKGIKSLAGGAVNLSSKLIPGDEKMTLTSNTRNINSGETFTLNWSRGRVDDGYYTLSYSCKNGLHLEMAEEGQEGSILSCDTEYKVLDNENKIDLAVFSIANRYADAEITLSFTKENETEIEESADIVITVTNPLLTESRDTLGSVSPSPSASPSLSPVPSKSPVVIPQPSQVPWRPAPVPTLIAVPTFVPIAEDPNGKPDLKITILEVGTVNSRDVFTRESEIDENDTAAVRFEVQNIGTKRTGTWRFESKLPTRSSYTFRSDNEPSLMPQDKVVFTLSFDEFRSTSRLSFDIEVDPTDKVDESNERNNEATVVFRVED